MLHRRTSINTCMGTPSILFKKMHQVKFVEWSPECAETIFSVLLLHSFDDFTIIINIIARWSISIPSRTFLELHGYPSTITGVPARLRVRYSDWDDGDRKTISTGITTLFHSIRNITDKSVYSAQTRPLWHYLSYSARKQVQSATFFILYLKCLYYEVSVTSRFWTTHQSDQGTAGNLLSVIKAFQWLMHLGLLYVDIESAQWENRLHATGIFGHYENYRCHVVLNENKYTTLSRERQMKMCRLKVPGWHSPAVPSCNYGHSFPLYFQKTVACFLMQGESTEKNVDLLTRVWLVCPEIVNSQGCNLKNAFVILSFSLDSEWEPKRQSQRNVTAQIFSR